MRKLQRLAVRRTFQVEWKRETLQLLVVTLVSSNYNWNCFEPKENYTMSEFYKDIEGYNDEYQVSNLGNVKSVKRNIVLKPDTDQRGYKRVTLCQNGKIQKFLVHRLVAQAFIANPLGKPHVNHIDNTPGNDWEENLEWCTHSENMLHAHKQGRLANEVASLSAVPHNYLRYAKIHQERLGNRFIRYYTPNEILLDGRTKATSAVMYVCEMCGQERIGLVSNKELTAFNGRCPNCQNLVNLVDEDIV